MRTIPFARTKTLLCKCGIHNWMYYGEISRICIWCGKQQYECMETGRYETFKPMKNSFKIEEEPK